MIGLDLVKIYLFLICVSTILINGFYFSPNIIIEFFINSIISLTSIILIYNESFKELKKLRNL